ncbi:MAG: FKBP-type peptidyl-prolyl cis-trans isomerase [Treponema sp.]|jgi:FKBP-type peptidyl-prolyl cis-trans isomerase|nr:FKBP-type peptidyl-prolyl cis-trans isomerase [Treponema sp.]
MKRQLAIIFLGILVFTGCKEDGKTANSADKLDADTSYAFGLELGGSFKAANLNPEYNDFLQGIKDSIEGKETRFSVEEARSRIQAAVMSGSEKRNEGLIQAEAEFLAENSRKPGIVVTGSGLQYEVISEGTGARPADTDTVRVNYEGTLSNGTVFDSSYSRGEPAEFPLNQVISGWIEGIQLMRVGSKYKFYIPSDLGYGPQDMGIIPPYSPLVFEVELLAVVKD